MRVECDVDEIELDGDYAPVPSVCVTCQRCNHAAEVYGRDDASVRRGMVMLRDECPRGENNYYVAAPD